MSLKNVLDGTIELDGGEMVIPDPLHTGTVTAAQGASIPIIRCDNYIVTPKVIGESIATQMNNTQQEISPCLTST